MLINVVLWLIANYYMKRGSVAVLAPEKTKRFLKINKYQAYLYIEHTGQKIQMNY